MSYENRASTSPDIGSMALVVEHTTASEALDALRELRNRGIKYAQIKNVVTGCPLTEDELIAIAVRGQNA